MIGLKGNLESIFLSSILQLLCNDKKSGMLRVWNAVDEVRIFFDRGTIVYSTGSQKSTRLGYLLRSERLIPEDQLWYCLELAREKKTALGKILVERGLISHEKLEELNSWKVEQTLYNLFLWTKGEFEFLDRELNLEGHILTQIDTMEIILESSRRADEMSLLLEKFPEETQVMERTGTSPPAEEAPMDSDAEHILSLIDGTRTIKDIIAQSKNDGFTVYKVLDELSEAGVVIKSMKDRMADSNDRVYLTTIIQAYYEGLTLVCREIVKKSDFTVYEIFTQCLMELEPRQQLFLKDLSLMLPVARNIETMESKIAVFSDQEAGRLFLINTFDDLLLNLMNSHKAATGEEENRKLIQKVENILSVLHHYRKDSSFGIEIISSEGTPDITLKKPKAP